MLTKEELNSSGYTKYAEKKFDSNGRLIYILDRNFETFWSYLDDGSTERTDHRIDTDETCVMRFDNHKNSIYIKNYDGEETYNTFEYDAAGRLIHSIEDSTETWYEYHEDGTTYSHDNYGEERWTTFDEKGQKSEHEKNSSGGYSCRTYDINRRLIHSKTTYSNGEFEEDIYEYDEDGNEIYSSHLQTDGTRKEYCTIKEENGDYAHYSRISKN